MRYSLFIVLIGFIVLSCKKNEPKKGYWHIKFYDGDDRTHGSLTLQLAENGSSLEGGGGDGIHYSSKCVLTLLDNKITEGELSSYSSSQGHTASYRYSEFKGTYDRKSGSGTYRYTKTLEYSISHPPPNSPPYKDSTVTGTGTFTLKWLYKKDPDEKQ